MSSDLLVIGCSLGDRAAVDVRVRDGVVAEIGDLRRDGERVLDARGGALIPGLHDHHLHLHALAADLDSVRCGPSDVRSLSELGAVLRTAAKSGPVRGTGYHESVGGPLDRHVLDALMPDVPVRIQHRSGAGWFLNSACLDAAGLGASRDPALERDADDIPTGRLWRGDHLLRRSAPLPDLTAVGRLLSGYGVTGVTDATPRLTPPAAQALRDAHVRGELPQRLLLLGASLNDRGTDVGPWKILLDEATGLDLDSLAQEVRGCRAAQRAVAFHVVSLAEAVIAVAALRAAGTLAGDRLEHGGLLPHDLDAELRELGVTVVTQPTFLTERGDDYLTEVDRRDHRLLYRCRSLLDVGIPVAASTDAPYGDADPWQAMAAAVSRRTRHGKVLGDDEVVTPHQALAMFLGSARRPGGPARQVAPGAVADLCLLDAPVEAVLRDLSASHVTATVIAGQVVHERS